MIEQLLPIDSKLEAATGFSRQSLYRLCRQGLLPHVRFGQRRIRIPASALNKWIAEQAAKNSEAQEQEEVLRAAA